MKLFVSLVLCAFVALPAVAADVDTIPEEVFGAWQLEFTTPEYEQKSPVIIVGHQRKELVAWYAAEDELQAFSEVELEGEELRLTFRPEKYDGDVLVTFSGHLKEDGVCEGDIDYKTNDGDSGTFEFAGKRIELPEFDKTTVWGISFETPDGEQREGRVTALTKNSKTYGWYSSEDYELPAKKMTQSADKVVMSLSMKTKDGETVDMTLRGTVEGDRISGDIEYSLNGETGSFAFTGKRAS